MILRPYQLDAVEQIRKHFREGSKRPLLTMCTGAGKTATADYIISSAAAKGGRPIFLAARRELVHQASKRLSTPHGVIMSGDKRVNADAPVQVCSVQSLLTRELPFTPTLIFLDECHHSTAKTHQELLSRFPDIPVVGLSASPVRASGLGLGDYFTSLVSGPGVEEMVEQGWLVPPRHLAPPPGLDTLFADPVETWLRESNGVPTMAFCSTVGESVKLAERFNSIGVRALHVDGTTDETIRDSVSERLESGDIQVVVNFGILGEGVDVPCIQYVLMDRKTSSLTVLLQVAGRGMRLYPGKASFTFADHGGNIYTHGRIDKNRQWQLTKGRDVIAGASTADVSDDIRVCPTCFTVAPPAATHCKCGYKFFIKKKKTYRHKPGTLELHHDDGRITTIAPSRQEADYKRFLDQQRNGKKKDGTPFSPKFAFFRFMKQYGFPPRKEWG